MLRVLFLSALGAVACTTPVAQPCTTQADCPAAATCVQGLCQSGTPQAADGGGGGSVGPGVSPTLTVERVGSGTVRSTPAGIDCGDTCSAKFDAGTAVSLSATPLGENEFTGWTGGCSGAGDCKVTVTADVKVTASFKAKVPPPPDKVAITIALTGKGKVVSDPAGIDCGSTCNQNFSKGAPLTLKASAGDGFVFAGWSGPCSGTGDCKLTPTADATIGAKFTDLCEGLAPDVAGTPVKIQSSVMTAAQFGGCEPGAGDGAGNVTVAWWTKPGAPKPYTYLSVDKAGTLLGNHVYDGLRTIYGEASGYEGVIEQGSPFVYLLDAKGATVKTATLSGASTGFFDPTGGVIVYDPGVNQIRAFDAAAVERWHVTFTEPGLRTAGVDSAGHVLLLFDGASRYGAGTLAGRWIDHDGAHAGDVFRAADAITAGSTIELARRIPDGLFLSQDGRWLRQIASRATTSDAAPDWLLAKPPSRLRVARGGKAYALMTIDTSGATTCAAQVEVVAPAGRSCGVVAVPTTTGPCSAGSLDLTYDGTLLQLLPTPAACTSCTCSWQSFPGLLK